MSANKPPAPELLPPISIVPVFLSVDGTIHEIPGSAYQAPDQCKKCKERPCIGGNPDLAFQICPWGFEYARLTPSQTAYGIVFPQAGPHDTTASAKQRKRAKSDNRLAPPRAFVERSLECTASFGDALKERIDSEIEAAVNERLSNLSNAEVVAELRDEFNKFAAMNHDYVKVAAGIRANLDRLARAYDGLGSRPEAIAIEGAARRLEDLPSLHQLLVDPTVADNWGDIGAHRLFATVESYYYYLSPLASDRGIRFPRPACRQRICDSTVRASRRLLGGIILQLLDNAISYAHSDEIVSVAVDDPGSGEAAVIVESTGPRIDPSEEAKIFQPFYRGVHARSQRDGGGVGLAIVKLAAERLDGRVTVGQLADGNDRYRTTFTVFLPTC